MRHPIQQSTAVYNAFQDIPKRAYDIILADPPWSYYPSNHTHQITNHYPTLSFEQLIQGFNPSPLFRSDKTATLFLWATTPKLQTALDLITCWGLHYRGVAYVWRKTRQDGQPIGAQGVRPSFVKPSVELVLVATRIKKGRTLPLYDEAQGQWIEDKQSHFDELDWLPTPQVIKAKRQGHSVKPPQVQANIERLFGPLPRKLEMFARTTRLSWDAFGNEVTAA
jgi:N6-adenosine-specific RNA methylase IME4